MFKTRLFGYSKVQVDMLIDQIESDYHAEAEKLKANLIKLEEECELLKQENEADKIKVVKAKEEKKENTRSLKEKMMSALVNTNK